MDKLEHTNDNTTNDKISPFNTISRNNSKITKVRSQRNLKSPAALKLNPSDLEEELMMEIDKASKIIQSFRDKIPIEMDKNSSNSLESLRLMEDVIRSKDLLIQDIEEEIKMLKNGTYQFHPEVKDKPQNNVFRLANQIKIQKEQLKKCQNKFLQKQNEFKKKKDLLANVEKKYQEKCKKEGLKQITFQEFKQLYKKKRREEQQINKHKKFHKNSIKEMVKEKQYGDQHSDEKKMKQLMSKKNVAETALKTAKKKHQLQVHDLMGKLQFLRDQNTDLEERLQMKEQQLRSAQGKFSQSRTTTDKKIIVRRLRTEQKF